MTTRQRLEEIVTSLREFYDADDTLIWLNASHRLLDGHSPLEVMVTRPGGIAEVEALIYQLRNGAYV